MRYFLLVIVIALVCCTAQVAEAAPSITGVSADRTFFNSDTGSVEVHYQLADIVNGCPVIGIYGQDGKVKNIYPGVQSSGRQSVTWDGTNSHGVGVPDGEYTVLVYLSSLDSVRQPRLIKVFGSLAEVDEQVPGLAGGAAANSSGYVYTIDAANNSIRILSPEGVLLASFGSAGTGDGQFMSPVDVAVNASDYVFVSDGDNARVRAFDSGGRFITSWPVTPWPEVDYSNAGPIAINSTGYVYVVSNGERRIDNTDTPWMPDRQYYNHIQIFSPAGELIKSFGSYGGGDGQFGAVRSIAIDSLDVVYVADSLNHRILVLDRDGNQIASLDHSDVGLGDSFSPSEIGIGTSGSIYTVDSDNGCVEVFSPIVVHSTKVSVDNTPPVTDARQSYAMVNGWHNASVSIDLEATDGGSGVKELDYVLDDSEVHRIAGESATFVIANGVHKLDYWSVDNVGNEGNHNSIAVRVDTTPPVTGATLKGTGGDNGWYLSDVVVNLSADDAGAGIARIQHSSDGLNWIDRAVFTIGGEGVNPVYYRSIDYAGNVESARLLNASIDKTAPTIRCRFDGPSPQGWFTSDATATLFPADSESGIGITEYSLDNVTWNNYTSPFTVPKGDLNKVYYRTSDRAGNMAGGSSYLYFWPTSIPDIYSIVDHVPSPAPSSAATVSQIVPIYRLLPSATATATPGLTPNTSASVVDDSPDPVPTMIRILKIFGGFLSFLP